MKDYLEKHCFGVCVYLGEKMGVKTSVVRMYFIYLSFVTIGSPIVIYLFMAFWLNLKKYLRLDSNPVIS